jgi:ferredoxin
MSEVNEEIDELEKKFKKAARIILSAGMLPMPNTNTFIQILKHYLDEEDLDFILNFKSRSSMSMEQLLKKSKLPEEEINRMAAKLAKKGFIFNQPSSSGLMVFRLLPIVIIGTFEYTFMTKMPEGGEELNRIKELAVLYEKYMQEFADSIQETYEGAVEVFKRAPPTDRTLPLTTREDGEAIEIIMNEDVGEAMEEILPAKTVEEIIRKFKDIGVGYCFCRQYRGALGHECEQHAPLETCFTFGKSARHVIQQGFARKVSQEEALKILKVTEEAGLVHKAFHNSNDVHKPENSICNCCKDCCDTFGLWKMGATPIINVTHYLSDVIIDKCIACGICAERCPMEAITVSDYAIVDEKLCIGCGVCARACPENAIRLLEGTRNVFVPPKKIQI